MTSSPQQPSTPSRGRPAPRVLLADRGDPLTGPLTTAMRGRFEIVGHVDVDLTRPERLAVAGMTVRPGRQAWAERFFKSSTAVALRSRRARAGLLDHADTADVVFQTHALFGTGDPRTVMYVDCTHRQSMEQWPAWNPLRGRALSVWLDREGRQYQQAAHIFVFYEETARSLVEQYDVPRDRVSVVGAGVNFTRLPSVVHRPVDVEAPTVLFVGNDFERKGGHRLLEAFARLRAGRFPGARLLIAGTRHALPAQDGVEQLGRIRDRSRISELYAQADLFCLPSYFDPFPGALLEAMAHGLPCVTSATSGIPDIVGDPAVAALTVSRGRTMTDELVEAVEHLLDHPDEASAMGLRARRRVEERFLWSHVVDRMAPVLQQVADREQPSVHTSDPHAPRRTAAQQTTSIAPQHTQHTQHTPTRQGARQ